MSYSYSSRYRRLPYPRLNYRPTRDYLSKERRRQRIYEAEEIARRTQRIKKSVTYYGTPRYNYLQIKSSATYNLQFRFFRSSEQVALTGIEAFAQVVLTPGRSDNFMNNVIKNYDTFVVETIDWNYIPPATESLMGSYDSQSEFPFSNCVMRFVFDPTANVTNLNDIALDMKRYLPPEDDIDNNLENAMAIARQIVKKTQYETKESLSSHRGIIERPMCTSFNEVSIMSTLKYGRVETSNTWVMKEPVANLSSPDKGEGKVGVTYGTISLAVPMFTNGMPNRDRLDWPKFLAFLNVTYSINCYGQG